MGTIRRFSWALIWVFLSVELYGQEPINKGDSLALVDLYNNTNGRDWKENAGWLKDEVLHWYGVKRDAGGRVVLLSLPDNGLRGRLNQSIGDLHSIHKLDLSGNEIEGEFPLGIYNTHHIDKIDITNNQISSLPDLSFLPKIRTLLVSGNQLGFEDILPHTYLPVFEYLPQDSIGPSLFTKLALEEDFLLETDVPGNQNTYRWFKDGLLIEGATSSGFPITDFGQEDAGKYHCEIRSPLLEDLVLVTRSHFITGKAGINGTVSAGPGITGDVNLYRVRTADRYSLTATAPLALEGSFHFEDIAFGDYIILVRPNDFNDPTYTPTYYGNSPVWEKATVLNLTNQIEGLSIKLRKKHTINPGLATITGTLKDKGDNARQVVPMPGIDIYLMRPDQVTPQILALSTTDLAGEFRFDGLANGEYELRVSLPGMATASDAAGPLEITDNADQNVSLVAKDSIYLERQLVVTSALSVFERTAIFPNPADSRLFIDFRALNVSGYRITAHDLSGKLVIDLPVKINSSVGGNTMEIDTEGLRTGTYIFSLHKERSSSSSSTNYSSLVDRFKIMIN